MRPVVWLRFKLLTMGPMPSAFCGRIRRTWCCLILIFRRLSGHDVLVELRRDPNLRCLPAIVVSSSDNPADVQRAYNAHASLFLKKPLDLERYFSMVRTIKELWLDFAVLPQAGNGSGP